jgi:hypothetical protein
MIYRSTQAELGASVVISRASMLRFRNDLDACSRRWIAVISLVLENVNTANTRRTVNDTFVNTLTYARQYSSHVILPWNSASNPQDYLFQGVLTRDPSDREIEMRR